MIRATINAPPASGEPQDHRGSSRSASPGNAFPDCSIVWRKPSLCASGSASTHFAMQYRLRQTTRMPSGTEPSEMPTLAPVPWIITARITRRRFYGIACPTRGGWVGASGRQSNPRRLRTRFAIPAAPLTHHPVVCLAPSRCNSAPTMSSRTRVTTQLSPFGYLVLPA